MRVLPTFRGRRPDFAAGFGEGPKEPADPAHAYTGLQDLVTPRGQYRLEYERSRVNAYAVPGVKRMNSKIAVNII